MLKILQNQKAGATIKIRTRSLEERRHFIGKSNP